MYRFFFTKYIVLFLCISCANEQELSSPLKTFHTFLQYKNNMKAKKLYKLLVKDSISQTFFKNWMLYTQQVSGSDILKIRKSSCVIYTTELKDTVKITFKENFIMDTCLVYLVKKNNTWQVGIKKYPIMVQ